MNTWERMTTIEKLEMADNTVIKYDNLVLTTKEEYNSQKKDCVFYCAIYAFTTEKHSCDSPIAYITHCSQSFIDEGHAIEWCMKQFDNLFDDPIELLMNFTNPNENYTLAEMEKFVSQAIANGWRCPPDWTPQDFLDVYYDLESNEED